MQASQDGDVEMVKLLAKAPNVDLNHQSQVVFIIIASKTHITS